MQFQVLDDAMAWAPPHVGSRGLLPWTSSLCSIPGEGARDGVGGTSQSCAGSVLQSEAPLTLILRPFDFLLFFPCRGWVGMGV